jgi:hypothetical protein
LNEIQICNIDWLAALFDSGHRAQRSGSSLTVGERLCAVVLPCVAIAEFVFFALIDCLAGISPSSSNSSHLRRDPSAPSFLTANKRSHHRRRVGPGYTSLVFRDLARLADESRCCIENHLFAPRVLTSYLAFLAMSFDTILLFLPTESSLGERGGGAVRALQEDQLLHHQRRAHPQGTH